MKKNVGAVAFIVGLLGAGFGVGGVESSKETAELIASIGVAVTSLFLMQMGVWMIKEEI